MKSRLEQGVPGPPSSDLPESSPRRSLPWGGTRGRGQCRVVTPTVHPHHPAGPCLCPQGVPQDPRALHWLACTAASLMPSDETSSNSMDPAPRPSPGPSPTWLYAEHYYRDMSLG